MWQSTQEDLIDHMLVDQEVQYIQTTDSLGKSLGPQMRYLDNLYNTFMHDFEHGDLSA